MLLTLVVTRVAILVAFQAVGLHEDLQDTFVYGRNNLSDIDGRTLCYTWFWVLELLQTFDPLCCRLLCHQSLTEIHPYL